MNAHFTNEGIRSTAEGTLWKPKFLSNNDSSLGFRGAYDLLLVSDFDIGEISDFSSNF